MQPADLLHRAVDADPTRPFITFYDDAPDAGGERIELSRKVLRTWVAKAANALQEGLDVTPGSVVLIDLPAPHWRMAYWALAAWSVGATVTLDPQEGGDVLVTTDPDSELAEDCDEVVAVTLPALARSHAGELRSGVMDEAAELASYADDFTAWDEPEGSDDALVADGQRVSYAELSGTIGAGDTVPDGGRTLITTTDPARFVRQLLAVLAAQGSAVVVRGPVPAEDDPRLAAEGVDHRSPA